MNVLIVLLYDAAAVCEEQFQIYSDTIFLGEGASQADLDKFESCRDGCLFDETCLAFSYDHWEFLESGLRCTFYDDTVDLSEDNMDDLEFSELYILIEGCRPSGK